MNHPPKRYHRQEILPQIQAAGQQRLAEAQVLVVGCGALGCNVAMHLARAGLGRLRLVDRDLVDWSNLQRQVLFGESDAQSRTPKALAAAHALQQYNSQIRIEPVVADFNSANAESLAGICGKDGFRAQLILDGTDNAQTRYLINDLAVRHRFPWIYGGCVGVEGRIMTIVPGSTPCLRCLFPQPPAPGELATCDTAGVLGPAAAIVGALQAAAAIRHLVDGSSPAQMLALDAWAMRFQTMDVREARNPDCLCCGKETFEFLDRPPSADSAVLCGRTAVQVASSTTTSVDLQAIARRLETICTVQNLGMMVRCQLPEGLHLSIFSDGRAIVDGTSDLVLARSIMARYVGS